jgi:DegV family protein with EDD domain
VKKMSQIKIVTDSSCGVTDEEIKKYDISIVPLSVMIDDTIYVEGETITNEEFIQKMTVSKTLPKTSQPPLGKFVEMFDQLGEDGSEIISFNMLEAISGTVHTAEQAAQLSKSNVTVVDSQFTDRALAFQVLEAAKMAQAGASKDEILERAAYIRDHTTLYLGVVNLENLVKGGRLSKISGMLGGLLNIKLLLQVKNGKLDVANKVRGMKAMKKLWLDIYAKMQSSKVREVGISHVQAFDAVEDMKKHVGEFFPVDQIVVRETVPIIATHTGMGAFCILYYSED